MKLKKIRDALAWRLRTGLGDKFVDRILVTAAQGWRPLLARPVFIGVLGSVAKTTTKEMLLRILSHHGRATASPASLNVLPEVAKTVLRVSRRDDFCVAELSEDSPGILEEQLALVRPRIAIVTVIGNDHWSAYGSQQAIAEEMAKLVVALPAAGTAVLNADDQQVLAMAARCAGRVITYGTSPQAQLRAENVRSAWPERLSFTLVQGCDRVDVHTRLCGAHWLTAVLGAIGGGLAAGRALTECVAAAAAFEPFEGRMQPVTAGGVTFIRDDWKAPLWTVDACLEFIKAARATRKIVVFGELSDVGSSKGAKYAKVARRAQEVADLTVFVGPWASAALQASRPGREDGLRIFGHVREVSAYLQATLREGDLVLLKGTNKQDHLLRIILARDGGVACWRDDCGRIALCDACPDLHKPSGLPGMPQSGNAGRATAEERAPPADLCGGDEQVIIGLGNPGAQYAATPHNVGHIVVDRIADSRALSWEAVPGASIARGSLQGQRVCLVKIDAPMNLIGAGLKRLSQAMGFGPGQCILVFDDLALSLGTVRIRQNGSAGGHRGVASILEAFQTNAFRRIKIGIGSEAARRDSRKYVLTAFDEPGRAAVDEAVAAAQAMLLQMMEKFRSVKARAGAEDGRNAGDA